MKIEELELKAREVTPNWLATEIDDMLEMIQCEREVDEESWGDDWNFFEVLDHFDSSDFGDCRKFKLALTKIERHIGIQQKLGKGETAMVCSSYGTRNLKEGDWYLYKTWEELVSDTNEQF